MSSDLNKYELRGNAVVLATLFVVVQLAYFKTWQAGFVTDFTGLQERLDGAPFWDFLHCFGFPALHQVTNFFLYLFCKLFGTSPLPWYLIYTTLHVLNGWLGYRLVKKIFEVASPVQSVVITSFRSNIFIPAFVVALLFLLSPYNAEAVIWKVCFNFLFCTAMMLSSLLFWVKYLEKGERKQAVFSLLFFAVALFTFELALALPLIATAFFFFWKKADSGVGSLQRPLTAWSVTPYFILSGIYFLLNKILLGGWVGHYGEGVHLNYDIQNIASNCLKYFSKNLIYWREWEHGTKQSFISFCDNPITAYAFVVLGITLLSAGIIFYQKINKKIKTIGFSWLLFFMALAPVANLYLVWLLHGENDRYGYFASLFFYMGLVAFFQLFNNKIKYFLYTAFLLMSIYNLNKINNFWKNSTDVVSGLLADFKWENNSEIYVLAFPENYQGIPMFKDFSRQDLALKSALKHLAKKQATGQFYQVAQFNMNTPTDGLTATVDSANVIRLEFHEWGSWWWRHGLGAGPYERDQYDFRDASKGCEIEIKKAAKDAVFIYSDGATWKEVKF